MAIYTRRGKEYLVTKDWLLGDLHIPMHVIRDAITHTVADGDFFDAYQIEAYIRDAMTLFKPTNTETTPVPSAEGTSLDDADGGRPLTLVIGGEVYSFNVHQYGTLSELAAWISETLNQAKEQVTEAYIAELEDLGSGQSNVTLKIKI